jgi:hypothetical protein
MTPTMKVASLSTHFYRYFKQHIRSSVTVETSASVHMTILIGNDHSSQTLQYWPRHRTRCASDGVHRR